MFVTQSTLVGQNILNGTFGLQLALFVGCLYNVIVYPDAPTEFFTNPADVDIYN